MQRYQDMMEAILTAPPLTTERTGYAKLVDEFQKLYGNSAYICRYPRCRFSSDGFSSKTTRENHERIHARPLRCVDTSCDFYVSGFTNKVALQKHNRNYHIQPGESQATAEVKTAISRLQRMVPPVTPSLQNKELGSGSARASQQAARNPQQAQIGWVEAPPPLGLPVTVRVMNFTS